MTRTVRAPASASLGVDAVNAAVLAERLVQPVFQPIVELSSRAVVGLEALARGPAETAVEFRTGCSPRLATWVVSLSSTCGVPNVL